MSTFHNGYLRTCVCNIIIMSSRDDDAGVCCTTLHRARDIVPAIARWLRAGARLCLPGSLLLTPARRAPAAACRWAPGAG